MYYLREALEGSETVLIWLTFGIERRQESVVGLELVETLHTDSSASPCTMVFYFTRPRNPFTGRT